MRIAVYHDLPSGGAKRALLEQVRGLAARGHTVDLYLPSTADEEFLPLAPYAHATFSYALPAPPPRERMLEGRPSPLDPLRWLHMLASVRAVSARVAADIDARGYDVALVHPSQFTQAPWLLRFLRTRSLYYCHEPLRAAWEPGISGRATRLAIRATLGGVDRRNVAHATALAVNSRFTQDNVRRIYGREADVAYLGVNTDTFRPVHAERGPYVLAVAALHPLKGLPFLVDALGTMPDAARPPLRVVSDRARDAERRRLEQRAAGRGVALEFEFRVSEQRLASLYAAARVVLYAPHREPFGFVPLEAMASGRPVLAVRDGGIPETVVDGVTGFLAGRDAAAFGARLDSLLRDTAAAEAVAAAAAAHVRTAWTWQRAVDALERLCMDVAGHSTTLLRSA